MRANTVTKLSLLEWCNIIGINPLHFGGIDLEAIAGAHCAKPWVQYEWQDGDRVGREAVARAISMAEANMERALGFRLKPTLEVNERIPSTQLYPPERFGNPSKAYRTRWGYVISGGKRATAACTSDPIVWSDDAYWQMGTVEAVVPAGTEACEVHAYYPDKGPDPRWEIRPIDVSIAGVTATITFRREQVVKEELWDNLEFGAARGDEDADFLDEIAVYRETIDPEQQVNFRYEPWGLCNCDGAGCTGCTIQTEYGCFYIHDEQLGLVVTRSGTWEDSTFTAGDYQHHRRPDSVDISYLSGWQQLSSPVITCPALTMDPELAQAVAYYSAALLERPPCDCQVDSWEYWREDAARGEAARFAAGVQQFKSPFGTRRGALYAWEKVRDLALAV